MSYSLGTPFEIAVELVSPYFILDGLYGGLDHYYYSLFNNLLAPGCWPGWLNKTFIYKISVRGGVYVYI